MKRRKTITKKKGGVSNSNNSNTTNTNANKNTNTTGRTDFNRMLSNMSKSATFKGKEQPANKVLFATNSNYQASFGDIIAFEKGHAAQKAKLDTIIYHASNNDGLLSAYIAWRYLTKDLGKKDVALYGYKPSHSAQQVDQTVERNLSRLTGRNIIILDLSYNEQTITALSKAAASVISIDDHNRITKKTADVFVGDDRHSACAYTWKFFNPTKPVPRIVQYIDDSDRKLHLAFLPFSNLFASSFGIRYGHTIMQSNLNTMFEKLHVLFENNNPNFWIFIGKYMEEMKDALKEQIAINARPATFGGSYKVYVLNFGSPALLKPVARQIISNYKSRGENADFVVIWDYEYSLNGGPAFSLTMVEDHQRKAPQFNLPELAQKIGRIAPHPRGAGGSKYIGHAYFTGNIFDLFNGKIKL